MNRKILESIERSFNKYETYYQVLGLKTHDVTDEKVKVAYESMCKQLNGMFGNILEEEIEKLKEKIQRMLDDAYIALKTEDSRRNYQELLNQIEGDER